MLQNNQASVKTTREPPLLSIVSQKHKKTSLERVLCGQG